MRPPSQDRGSHCVHGMVLRATDTRASRTCLWNTPAAQRSPNPNKRFRCPAREFLLCWDPLKATPLPMSAEREGGRVNSG